MQSSEVQMHRESQDVQKAVIPNIASNPGFPFRILSRSFFSPKLRDKIQNGKPGFEAIPNIGSHHYSISGNLHGIEARDMNMHAPQHTP